MEGYSYRDSPSGKIPFRARPSLTVLTMLWCAEEWCCGRAEWCVYMERHIIHKLLFYLDLRLFGVIKRLLQLCCNCNLKNAALKIVPSTAL
jgi:hypothetical protein